MRALMIDDQVKKEIDNLKSYAAMNMVKADEMLAISEGRRPPRGDFKAHTIHIANGFRVVYTIEDHPQSDKSVRRCRHLSVSVASDNKKAYPHPYAIDALLPLFDFKMELIKQNNFKDCHLWQEEESRAINIVELIETIPHNPG